MANKNTGMRIRIEKELRQEFLDVCRTQDRPAAQVLREFMRDYIRQHHKLAQADLFPLLRTDSETCPSDKKSNDT